MIQPISFEDEPDFTPPIDPALLIVPRALRPVMRALIEVHKPPILSSADTSHLAIGSRRVFFTVGENAKRAVELRGAPPLLTTKSTAINPADYSVEAIERDYELRHNQTLTDKLANEGGVELGQA